MTKIFIDPGHGGHDSGARGHGLEEKNLTLSISLKIRDMLTKEYQGVSVKLSRTRDQALSLRQRTDMANNWGADYYLSLHINAGGGSGWENYIYIGGVFRKTKQLQDALHANVTEELSPYSVRDRGKKQANFHVLRETRMPASLSENLFIDTEEDAELLKNDQVIEAIAQGHVNGLAEGLALKMKSEKQMQTLEEDPKSPPHSNVLRKGNRGDRVRELQQQLYDLGYDLGRYGVDGIFGNDTEKAVHRFQTDCGIKVDGLAGPQTLSVLNDSYELIKKGSRGPAVRGLQNRLLRAGYELPRYGADGIVGSETIATIKQLQRDAQIAVDGIVGPQTRKALAKRLR